MTLIISDQNPSIKLIKQLLSSHRQRKKSGLAVIEGTHLFDSALRANYSLKQVCVSETALQHTEVVNLLNRLEEKQPTVSILTLSDKLYQSIRTLGTGIDIMAILPVNKCQFHKVTQDCLVLNGVQDSGNVGTLLRTAAAVGITEIICTSGTAGAWSPKTLRAAMGAHFSLNIYENITVDELLSQVSIPMFATSSHTKQTIYQSDFNQPVVWIMGHEGQGVCDEILEKATKVTIPQPNGQESLNVAIAGALCMYEMLRQREYS